MLQSYIDFAPHLLNLLGTDEVIIIATNESEYSYILDPKQRYSHIKPGTPLDEQSAPFIAMNKKAPYDAIEEDEHGIKWRYLIYPVEGGSIGVIHNYDNRHTVVEAIHQLKQSEREIASSSKHIVSNSTSLMEAVSSIESVSLETFQRNKKVIKNVQAVKEIVQQLQILRLNSSIEAARAGEQGKKFMIVAEHVHSLALEGEKRVNEVNKVLRNVSSNLSVLHDSVQAVAEVFKNQQNNGENLSKLSSDISKAIETLSERANRFQ